ncbi:MAG TPA: hypothetical protein VLB11_07830 [Methyloceanibacter sp.]|nr:hypothetical protein [Methyloceanibacter sp.]
MLLLFRLMRVAFAVAVLAVLVLATFEARAEQPLTNLGPVGPGEPLLVTVGEQRFIAFFTPERSECAISAVTWKDADPDEPYSSARVRVSLKPGQLMQLDGPQRRSMGLLCGADAASLAIIAPAELILAGTAEERN